MDRAILERPVHVDGADRPFGTLTAGEIERHAATLQAAVGWGPTARVASFARAWAELGRRMREAGAATVAELDAATLDELAGGLWP